MAIVHFVDGVKIGPDTTGSERATLYNFGEFCTPSSIDLGIMAANERRILVISNVPGIEFGSTVIARPLNPFWLQTLLVQHAWTSGNNEVSVLVKNDSDVPVDYAMGNDQWNLTFFSTSPPYVPEEPPAPEEP